MNSRKNTPSFQQFILAIADSYQNYNYENANFLAERLYYSNLTEKARTILAETKMTSQNYQEVYELLKKPQNLRQRYLYALSCYKLSKYKEAEKYTYKPNYYKNIEEKKFSLQNLNNVINDAHGLFLMG